MCDTQFLPHGLAGDVADSSLDQARQLFHRPETKGLESVAFRPAYSNLEALAGTITRYSAVGHRSETECKLPGGNTGNGGSWPT
jgi:hypothetical protein